MRKNQIVLLLAVIVSIAMRIPNLDRPLSKHHEFVTAHVLRVLQIWDEGGIANYHFAPVMNYPGSNNKYISNQDMGYYDANGDYYYLSYPPFNFILPYFIFQLLHITISALPLQCFNILLQILGSILLYRIVLLLVNNERRREIATLSTVFFLINPCSLWFCANVYFADMLVIFFWLTALYLLLLLKEDKNFYLKLFLFGMAIFFGNYTEYLMLMFSGMAILYIFKSGYRSKGIIITIILINVVIPYFLTIYQYSLINGWEAFLHQSISRYRIRSGYDNHHRFLTFLAQWRIIIENYIVHYIAFILLLIASLTLFLIKRNSLLDYNVKAFLLLIILPVLLHHLIFLNASMHDFQVLKSGVPIAILSAVITYSYFPRQVVLIAAAILLINVLDYYYINKPGPVARNGDEYATDYNIAQIIKSNSNNDEVIFINTDVGPQVVYYAHRNIFRYATKENAAAFLREHHLATGILFYFNDSNHLTGIDHITP